MELIKPQKKWIDIGLYIILYKGVFTGIICQGKYTEGPKVCVTRVAHGVSCTKLIISFCLLLLHEGSKYIVQCLEQSALLTGHEGCVSFDL